MALDNETKLYIREVVHEALEANRGVVDRRIAERIEHHVLVCANRGYKHWHMAAVAVGSSILATVAPTLVHMVAKSIP